MNRPHARRTLGSVLLIAGHASLALAQPLETLTLTIAWDKPVIAPGEANSGAIYATASPEIGSTTAWNTPPGMGQPGMVKAFASTIFDFTSLQNGAKGTLAWTRNPEFAISLVDPKPDGAGGFTSANLGQFGLPVNPSPNVNGTVKLVDLQWIAASKVPPEPLAVVYQTKAATAKIFLEVGLTAWVGESAIKIDGQGGFTVIPAPTATAIALPALLLATRRRRRP